MGEGGREVWGGGWMVGIGWFKQEQWGRGGMGVVCRGEWMEVLEWKVDKGGMEGKGWKRRKVGRQVGR